MDRVIAWWIIILAAVFPVSIAASSLLYFPLLGFYILLGAWTFKRWPPEWGPTEKAFTCFWIVSLLSALLGAAPWYSRIRLGKDLYFFILVLLTAYLAQEKTGPKLMKAFMISTLLTACFGILQRIIGVNQSTNAGGYFLYMPPWLSHAPRSLQNHLSMVTGRAVGTRAHPLTYAEGLLFALGYALSRLTGRRADWWKWAVAQYVILLGLVVSQSRGAWLAAIVMVIVACLLNRDVRFYKQLAVIYFSIGLCFLSPALRARAFSITKTTYEPNAERLEMWRAGAHMIKDHPLLGVGTGTMTLVSPHYQSEKQHLAYGPWGHLHSAYINSAAERGLLGLAAFLTFIVVLAFELWEGYRLSLTETDDENRMIILTGLLGLVGWLVAGFTEAINHDSNVLMMFYFVMGLALAASRDLLKNLKRV